MALARDVHPAKAPADGTSVERSADSRPEPAKDHSPSAAPSANAGRRFRLAQPRKASAAMAVTPGAVTEERAVQPAKALGPMAVQVSGRMTDSRAVHPAKQSEGISAMAVAERSAVTRKVQPAKSPSARVVTAAGGAMAVGAEA